MIKCEINLISGQSSTVLVLQIIVNILRRALYVTSSKPKKTTCLVKIFFFSKSAYEKNVIPKYILLSFSNYHKSVIPIFTVFEK
jgi:hypothetical protein